MSAYVIAFSSRFTFFLDFQGQREMYAVMELRE